jgi:outer membrane protein, adhesin transport system
MIRKVVIKPRLWVAMAMALGASLSNAQQAWTPLQLMQAAWDTHPALASKRASAAGAQHELEGARWQRFPTPTIETGRATDGGVNNTTLRLDQPLWTGGRITAGIEAAKSRLDAAEATVAEGRNEMALQVISAWAEAYRQQMRQAHAITGVNEHVKLLKMITRRTDQEVSPPVDRDFAHSRLLQSMNDLSLVTQSLNIALTKLTQLAGQPVLKVGVPVSVALPAAKDQAISEAMAYSPTLMRIGYEEQAAASDVDSKRASLMPQVSFRVERVSGGLTAASSYTDNRALVVLTAQPGAGLSAASGVDAAQAKKEAIRLSREALAREVTEQVLLDWDDLVASKQRLANSQQSRNISLSVFESYTRQYVAGRKSWIDVLNAMRESTQSDLALADATAQVAAATQRLKIRTGRMTQASTEPSKKEETPK